MSTQVADRPPRRGWTPSHRTRVAAVAAVAALVVLLAASQAFLPGIVESRLKSNLTPFASDVSISVRAAPAVELLFGRADDVNLHIGTLHAQQKASVPNLLQQIRSTTNANASVRQLVTPKGLRIENLYLRKRGGKLVGSAAITPGEIAAALPHGIALGAFGVGPHGLSVAASVRVLGHTLRASATLQARGGKILLVPNVPLLPTITLFSDPRVAVDALHFSTRAGAYVFSAQGHLT